MRADLGPLDLDLATAGYLSRPDGRVRHVFGLEPLASDAQRLGARITWDDLPGDMPACCALHSGTIRLAPWLFYAWPWVVRSVILHELLHLRAGPSEENVGWWMQRFQDLICVPEWV